MAELFRKSGCKVGWVGFSTEAEALAESQRQHGERERKFALGYDFGYLWPSSVEHVAEHAEHGEHWVVTTV